MKKKSFNVLTFWAHITRPSLLQIVQKEKPHGTLWGAWFLWNTVLTLVLTGFAFWGLSGFLQSAEEEFWPQVPEFNFVFEEHQLVSTGLEEPFRFEFEDPEEDIAGAFIIDLGGELYDESSLKVFDVAVLINKDSISVYEADKHRTQTIPFKEFPEFQNKTITKQDAFRFLQQLKPSIFFVALAVVFIFAWFFYCILRLIWISVMAFLFWILGLITRVKGLTYGDCFVTTLGLSFIPALVGMGFVAFGSFSLWFSILLYGILFGLNIYDAPKSLAKKS